MFSEQKIFNSKNNIIDNKLVECTYIYVDFFVQYLRAIWNNWCAATVSSPHLTDVLPLPPLHIYLMTVPLSKLSQRRILFSSNVVRIVFNFLYKFQQFQCLSSLSNIFLVSQNNYCKSIIPFVLIVVGRIIGCVFTVQAPHGKIYLQVANSLAINMIRISHVASYNCKRFVRKMF